MSDHQQRIDKWLWFARFIKTRSAAARLVADGRVRVNRIRIVKPSHALSVDDVLTFTLNHKLRVVRVLAPGTRRGPAAEARLLYEDLTEDDDGTAPPGAGEDAEAPPAAREAGSGRPTKKERRQIDAWLDQDG